MEKDFSLGEMTAGFYSAGSGAKDRTRPVSPGRRERSQRDQSRLNLKAVRLRGYGEPQKNVEYGVSFSRRRRKPKRASRPGKGRLGEWPKSKAKQSKNVFASAAKFARLMNRRAQWQREANSA
jgi:hypothetical protein